MSDARLEVTDAMGRRIVPISKGHFEIGRRETNDLRLAGSEVSRDHAEILVQDNRFLLRDRNSRYGTYVNGDQVTERALAHGDRVRLGRTGGAEMVFLLADTAPPVERATTTAIGDLRQIAVLLEGLRALGSGRVLDDVLSLVLDSAIEVGGAERGFIMLDQGGELEFKMARNRGRVVLPGGSFATSRKIPEEVFRTGEAAHRRRLAGQRACQLPLRHRGARHPQRAVRAAPARAVSGQGGGCRRRTADRRAVSRQPREGIAAVELDARRARDACDRSRGCHRECQALSRDDGEGADGAGDADRCRDPAGAPAQGWPHGRLLPCGGRVAAMPIDRRRLLRLRRPVGWIVRLRARRRGGQGAAGGAPQRDDAGHVCGSSRRQRSAVADHQPRQPRALPPRDRVAVRDADVWRSPSRRPFDLLQRRAQPAVDRRTERLPPPRARRTDRRDCSRARATKRRRCS